MSTYQERRIRVTAVQWWPPKDPKRLIEDLWVAYSIPDVYEDLDALPEPLRPLLQTPAFLLHAATGQPLAIFAPTMEPPTFGGAHILLPGNWVVTDHLGARRCMGDEEFKAAYESVRL